MRTAGSGRHGAYPGTGESVTCQGLVLGLRVDTGDVPAHGAEAGEQVQADDTVGRGHDHGGRRGGSGTGGEERQELAGHRVGRRQSVLGGRVACGDQVVVGHGSVVDVVTDGV